MVQVRRDIIQREIGMNTKGCTICGRRREIESSRAKEKNMGVFRELLIDMNRSM